jgi:hypothetical protein
MSAYRYACIHTYIHTYCGLQNNWDWPNGFQQKISSENVCTGWLLENRWRPLRKSHLSWNPQYIHTNRCVHTHTNVRIYTHTNVRIYTHKCTYIHTHKCTYIHTHKCTYIHTYTNRSPALKYLMVLHTESSQTVEECMYIRMYVGEYIHTYTYIYIYIHTYTNRSPTLRYSTVSWRTSHWILSDVLKSVCTYIYMSENIYTHTHTYIQKNTNRSPTLTYSTVSWRTSHWILSDVLKSVCTYVCMLENIYTHTHTYIHTYKQTQTGPQLSNIQRCRGELHTQSSQTSRGICDDVY